MDDNRSDLGSALGSEPKPKKNNIKKWLGLILIALFSIFLIRAFFNWHNQNKKPALKPVPVVLGTAKKRDMPFYIPALGTVTALDTVTVRTQVNGTLQKINYDEGQAVKAGDVIIEIDPSTYLAQLEQFEGQLKRDQALLANAKIDLDRYETLFKQDSVSQQTLETQRWLVRQLEGTIQLDQGQIDQVKVNLAYCYIRSPIDGQMGLRLVDLGNVVKTTDTTGLVVINTIQPISVIFTIPEDDLPQLLQQAEQGKGLIVEAYDRADNKLLATGTVLSLDNQIDTSTGTVKMRAAFTNENKILFPNQFVNVQLKVSTLQNAIVIPKTALQYGAQGRFVFVVNKKENQAFVKVKPVTVLATVKEDAAILGEVLANQEVVVEGGDNLRDETLIQSVPRSTQSSVEDLINKVGNNNHSLSQNGKNGKTEKPELNSKINFGIIRK